MRGIPGGDSWTDSILPAPDPTLHPPDLETPLDREPAGEALDGDEPRAGSDAGMEAATEAQAAEVGAGETETEAHEPDEGEPEDAEQEPARRRHSLWRELPILILVALVVAVIIKTFFIQAFYIPTGSMIPALEINDRVLVNKLSPRFGTPNRGDVIVFDVDNGDDRPGFPVSWLRSIGESIGVVSRDADLIKRVIGLPGETLEIRDNQVHINGAALDEPYLPPGVRMADFGPIEVPPGRLFVMGDNRNSSQDSRFFDPPTISEDDVVGRAFVKVWPPDRWGGL